MSLSPRTESDRNQEFLTTEDHLVQNPLVAKRDNFLSQSDNSEPSRLFLPMKLITDKAESQDEDDYLRIHNRRLNTPLQGDELDSTPREDDLSKFQITPKKIVLKPSNGQVSRRYFGNRETNIVRSEKRSATHFGIGRAS